MIMYRSKNGITLVALVITIVILLILAGVTIVTLTGDNGLITKAGQAKTVSEESVLREEIDLKLIQVQMGDKIEDIFGSTNVAKDGAVYEVKYKGKEFLLSSNYEYIEKVEASTGEWTFNEGSGTLTSYIGDLTKKRGNQEIGEVIIPNYFGGKRVKSLGREVFKGNNSLSKLMISEGIEETGDSTFRDCINLKGNLVIPNSFIKIGTCSFLGCTSLEGIKIGDNVRIIGSYAFYNCNKLKGDLIIPASVTKVEACAFQLVSNINNCYFFNKDTIIDAYSYIPGNVINGYRNSTAEIYAREKNKTFVAID